MKTKGVFSRYPRKISLLKDLRRGYLFDRGYLYLCKSMTTEECVCGYPPFLGGIRTGVSRRSEMSALALPQSCARGVKLSKNWTAHRCYRTANVVVYMLSKWKGWVNGKNCSSLPRRRTKGGAAIICSGVCLRPIRVSHPIPHLENTDSIAGLIL